MEISACAPSVKLQTLRRIDRLHGLSAPHSTPNLPYIAVPMAHQLQLRVHIRLPYPSTPYHTLCFT